LLTKTDPVPSPEANQSTFRIDWPPGLDDFGDEENAIRPRTLSGSGPYLTPGDATRHHRSRSDGARGNPIGRGSTLSRLGRVVGIDRGREAAEQRARTERARSREERRRQIEMG